MSSLSTQILVIGGGATGLGQGTTGRYHGVLHSGGRYVISDPKSAKECASENVLLRKIIPHAIEDTGGLFVATPSDPIEYQEIKLANLDVFDQRRYGSTQLVFYERTD